MSAFEDAVQSAVVAAGIRAEVFEEVCGLLERDSVRARENGDGHGYEVLEVALAKVRGLERNWETRDQSKIK